MIIYLTIPIIAKRNAGTGQGKTVFSSRLRTVGLSAEFGRGESGIALEGAAETENIGIAAFDRHLADRQIGMLDQFAGMVKAELMEKFSKRNAVKLTPDLQSEMRFGKMEHFGQIFDAERTVEIFPDQLEKFVHKRAVERHDGCGYFGLTEFSAQEKTQGTDRILGLIAGMFLVSADDGFQQGEIFATDRERPVHQRQQRLAPVAAVIETDGQKKTFRTGPAQIVIMDLKREDDNAAPGRDLEPQVVQSLKGGGPEIAFDLIPLMIAFVGCLYFPGRREKHDDVVRFDAAGVFEPAGIITGGRASRCRLHEENR